ncbi:hypothetical protein DF048_34780 [Burkholderia seminalis]|nr:hypothetical protein DF048_34780 [Burkholderia seminalis]
MPIRISPANAAAPTPATPGRSARSRRARAGIQRAQASLGRPDVRSFDSSPESFPAIRGGNTCGSGRGSCDGFACVTRTHWNTFLSAGAMV